MKKFICEECGKELKNLNVYNSHSTWHENNRKYPNGVDCPLCKKHFVSLKGLWKHVSMFHKENKEKIEIYRAVLDDNSTHLCQNCEKESILIDPSKGFERYCSIECRDILNKKSHKLAMENVDYSKVDFQSRTKKRKITNNKIYGTDNPSQSKIVKDKMKATNQERRGVDYPCEDPNVMNKRLATNNKKYGCDHGLSSPLVIQKRVDNLIKTKGVVNVFQLSDIKEKNVLKHLQNLGVTNPFVSKNSMINKSLFFYKKFMKKTEYADPIFTLEEWHKRKQKPFLQFECKTCKNKFLFSVLTHMKPRCFNCYPLLTKGESVGEIEVLDFIKLYTSDVVHGDRKVLKPKELDIYVPSNSFAIEFDGIYWHSEANKTSKEYHLLKTEKCRSVGIKLIHIFENEWKNKQSIIKSIILSNLNIYNKKIGARKCKVRDVDSKEARVFYDTNHLQGFIGSNIHIGLYYNNELVSCLSFSKPRFNKKYDWEITRYATKLNTQIVGGFGKLWKHKPDGSIITYSDKRYFSGNVYSKYMSQLPDTEPSYYYIVDGETRNRIEFQKHKLEKILPKFDPLLTEWENMQLNGYTRIWDCGNWCFEYKKQD